MKKGLMVAVGVVILALAACEHKDRFIGSGGPVVPPHAAVNAFSMVGVWTGEYHFTDRFGVFHSYPLTLRVTDHTAPQYVDSTNTFYGRWEIPGHNAELINAHSNGFQIWGHAIQNMTDGKFLSITFQGEPTDKGNAPNFKKLKFTWIIHDDETNTHGEVRNENGVGTLERP